jgi:hypothetical protein
VHKVLLDRKALPAFRDQSVLRVQLACKVQSVLREQ